MSHFTLSLEQYWRAKTNLGAGRPSIRIASEFTRESQHDLRFHHYSIADRSSKTVSLVVNLETTFTCRSGLELHRLWWCRPMQSLSLECFTFADQLLRAPSAIDTLPLTWTFDAQRQASVSPAEWRSYPTKCRAIPDARPNRSHTDVLLFPSGSSPRAVGFHSLNRTPRCALESKRLSTSESQNRCDLVVFFLEATSPTPHATTKQCTSIPNRNLLSKPRTVAANVRH